jgi:hypothetical protein
MPSDTTLFLSPYLSLPALEGTQGTQEGTANCANTHAARRLTIEATMNLSSSAAAFYPDSMLS